jgi:hypothetical protein
MPRRPLSEHVSIRLNGAAAKRLDALVALRGGSKSEVGRLVILAGLAAMARRRWARWRRARYSALPRRAKTGQR